MTKTFSRKIEGAREYRVDVQPLHYDEHFEWFIIVSTGYGKSYRVLTNRVSGGQPIVDACVASLRDQLFSDPNAGKAR